MTVDILKYQDIVGTLQEWGAVYQRDLFELVADGKTLQNFKYRIDNLLEKKALIRVKGGYKSRESILFLDKEFRVKARLDSTYTGSEYTAFHDAFCSRVVKYLYKNEMIDEYCFEHNFDLLDGFDFRSDLFLPDAIVNTFAPAETYFLEIEFSLKSRLRLKRKLQLLANSLDVQNVVYICTTSLVFNALRSEIANLKKGDSGKFYVLYLPNWSNSKMLFEQSVCFNLKRKTVFGVDLCN